MVVVVIYPQMFKMLMLFYVKDSFTQSLQCAVSFITRTDFVTWFTVIKAIFYLVYQNTEF